MNHAMEVAALLPSQATVTAVPRPAGLPAAWPVQVRNAPLPARMREAPASAPATASWRRLLLAVATLVSVGTVMYWTFGKPVFLVHRLDRATSGCLLLAFDRDSASALGKALMSQDFEKDYLAVCRGWPEPEFTVDHDLDGGPGKPIAEGGVGYLDFAEPLPAGPATLAVCQAIEDSAMARGSRAGGTILGAIALIDGPTNTRAAPCAAARLNRIGMLSASAQVASAKMTATQPSIPLAKAATWRRSNRSAAKPATGVSTNSGMNCASPSKPS